MANDTSGMAGRGITRREAMCRAAAFAGIAVAGGLIPGCGRSETEQAPVETRVPLASIPDGGRIVVQVSGEPIELRRDGAVLAALSLRCTHWGCTVAWNPRERVYDCPCHDGRYAADGRVVHGPPPRPLREVRVKIEGDAVVVLPRDGAGA